MASSAKRAFIPLILSVSTLGLVFLKTGFVFIIVAMLPSVLAYFFDRQRGRAMFKTVFACNLATLLHPLSDMLDHGLRNSQQFFAQAMGDPKIWLFVYTGAAAGWGLLSACGFLAHFGVIAYHDYQLAHFKHNQKQLIEEWGAAVQGETES